MKYILFVGLVLLFVSSYGQTNAKNGNIKRDTFFVASFARGASSLAGKIVSFDVNGRLIATTKDTSISSGLSGLVLNRIPLATSSTALGNSNLYQVNDNGAGDQSIGINIAPSGAKLHIDQTGSSAAFAKGTKTGTTYWQVANDGSIYSKPLDDGTSNTYMVTSTGGVLGKQAIATTTYPENLVIVTTNTYTVTGAEQNIILDLNPSCTVTLPTNLPDKTVVYITNQCTNYSSISAPVYYKTGTTMGSMAPGETRKLIFKGSNQTWWCVFKVIN